MSERVVWTYYISRDSRLGVLSDKCRLWYRHPSRKRSEQSVAWQSPEGFLGEYEMKDVEAWFRTLPETDLELIKVETYPTAEQLAASAKA